MIFRAYKGKIIEIQLVINLASVLLLITAIDEEKITYLIKTIRR